MKSLRFSVVLEDREDTTIIHFESNTKFKSTYICKEMSFRLFLEQNINFRTEKQACYHELNLIYFLSRYLNVISSSIFFVTTKISTLNMSSSIKDKTYVCETLYSYLQRELLQEALNESNATEERLLLTLTKDVAHNSYMKSCLISESERSCSWVKKNINSLSMSAYDKNQHKSFFHIIFSRCWLEFFW